MDTEAIRSEGRERRLLAKYPLHICLMVKAAAKALEDGRAEIRDGVLVLRPMEDSSQKGLIWANTVSSMVASDPTMSG